MATQELYLNTAAALPQLSQTNSFIHVVPLLVLCCGTLESLCDIVDRVCACHFGPSKDAMQRVRSNTTPKSECSHNH